MSRRARWSLVIVIAGLFIGGCAWLVWTNAPIYQVLVRLYVDKIYLKRMLREWGVLAPVIFIALQALQVIVSPIPGEATGILGGYLFGQWLGLLYSRSASPSAPSRPSASAAGSAPTTSRTW